MNCSRVQASFSCAGGSCIAWVIQLCSRVCGFNSDIITKAINFTRSSSSERGIIIPRADFAIYGLKLLLYTLFSHRQRARGDLILCYALPQKSSVSVSPGAKIVIEANLQLSYDAQIITHEKTPGALEIKEVYLFKFLMAGDGCSMRAAPIKNK